MMKTKLLLLTLAFFCFDQVRSQGADSLDINNVKAGFSPGYMFFNTDSPGYRSMYEVPKGEGKSSIFSSNLWLTGLDAGNNLRGFGALYGRALYPGPIAATYTGTYDSTYNTVWKITRAEVAYHLSHMGMQGYTVPPHIASWPGNGNVANGEAAILAPFIDVNNNGRYEPAVGDYPDFCGDEAIFMLLNDGAPQAAGIGCVPMGAEVHVLAYAFASADTALSNSIFLNVRVFNRSSVDYHDLKFSNFTDCDLGCSQNDRFGCDTVLNSFFIYNQPNAPDNGTSCVGGQTGYDYTKVAQGITFLDRKMTAAESFSNGGSDMGHPGTCVQLRNYQSGLWKDGTWVTKYGNGFQSSTNRINFLYPGEPGDSTAWSELHSQMAAPIQQGDRTGVGTVQINMLAAGTSFSVDMVYVTSFEDSAAPALSEIARLKNDIRHVRALYDQNLLCAANVHTGSQELSDDAVIIAPNPARETVMLRVTEAFRNESYTLTDMTGKVIVRGQLSGTTDAISVSGLASGLYILQVKDRSFKIVRE